MTLPPFAVSASRMGAYDYCPGAYHQQYILGIRQPPSAEMEFGSAVHKGLEQAYRGEDGQLAFMLDWNRRQAELRQAGATIPADLASRGLALVQQGLALQLQGKPEHKFVLDFPLHDIGATGYIDLYGPSLVVDWKTTVGKWNQARADKEIFQPALYSYAYFQEFGELPKFLYVILSRQAGVAAQVFEATRTEQQIVEAFEVMARIYERIREGHFDCRCRDRKHDQERAA